MFRMTKMKRLLGAMALFILAGLTAGCAWQGKSASTSGEKATGKTNMLTASDFDHAVLVSIDIQQTERVCCTEENMMPAEKMMGFTAEDKNRVTDFFFDTALPNATAVTDFFRRNGLPVVIVHWGFRQPEGMDLAPEVRAFMVRNYGRDWRKWDNWIERWSAQPNDALNVQEGDYVIAKTHQDAFVSSNIDYVLRNLGARTLFMIGGHTNPNGCLHQSSQSAIARGWRTICIHDVTFDSTESARLPGIRAINYEKIVSTDEVLAMEEKIASALAPSQP